MSQSETIFSLEGLLEIPAGHVNVKATTNEGMGFVGSGEGIAAYAVVLLVSRAPSAHNPRVAGSNTAPTKTSP